MIFLYNSDRAANSVAPGEYNLPTVEELRSAVWIDLSSPLEEETALVESALGVELPGSDDMSEIEASSRVYRENGADFMTALLVVGMDRNDPAAVPVSFILTAKGQLVTVRYCDPNSFRTAATQAMKQPLGTTGFAVLLKLLDLIVDRTADILEYMGVEIDRTSRTIFGRNHIDERRMSPADLQDILRVIGQIQFTVNKVHDSLQTLTRIATFLSTPTDNGDGTSSARGDKMMRDSLKSIVRDIASLTENSNYQMQNVYFLLDAAVGRISIEQNVIVKILSIASVVLMPPTLIASMYGMNFAHMPELESKIGYPLILMLMVASAILPYLYFRRKGWL